LPPGFTHVPFDDLDAIRSAIDATTVAVLLEPIQGEGGVRIPSDGYLPAVRELCDERDLLLICDEVWTGGGRTGRYFAHQHWGVTPDVITLAKGVGGGLPVGVCCILEKHAGLFDWRHYGRAVHATTLGGNAICMAAAARIFEVIERDGLVRRAAELGERTMSRLRRFAEQVPAVKQVRGKGMFIGIDVDPAADGAWFESGPDIVKAALARGVYINATQQTVLRLAPPLIISDDLLDRGLSILEGVIRG
jgi:acetylornithine/succinyldiaminopimelate/putrescine aminotransferase